MTREIVDGVEVEMTLVEKTAAEMRFVEDIARAAAREEIASLCGLILRRLQDEHPSRLMERNAMEDVLDEQLSGIFGEALQQFTADEDAA